MMNPENVKLQFIILGLITSMLGYFMLFHPLQFSRLFFLFMKRTKDELQSTFTKKSKDFLDDLYDDPDEFNERYPWFNSRIKLGGAFFFFMAFISLCKLISMI